MSNIFDDFLFESNGAMTLKDAVCRFLQEEIAFGRVKGGEKLPTMGEISEATGLTYGRARGVVERLEKEGYVHSRPYIGTVVLPRGGNILRGRVLLILPEADAVRYSPTILISTIGRSLTEAGYAFSVATFSLDPNDGLALLRSELLRATELVIALYATPNVHRHLAESGVNYILVCGDRPELHGGRWIRFSPESAVAHFAGHCARTGVRHVVQVRLDGDVAIDAQPALAKCGIDSSWLTISRGVANGGRYADLVNRACEMFGAMPRKRIRDLFLFWNTYVAQGAVMAFLNRGIRLPDDVKVVVRSDAEIAPVYTKPFTRFEVDPVKAGEKVANFALAVLAKGRIPRPPTIPLQYVFGATFPF